MKITLRLRTTNLLDKELGQIPSELGAAHLIKRFCLEVRGLRPK